MTENINDIPILYGPRTGKSLKRTYPEINENPVFKDIGNDDLLFAWQIGIPGSPIDQDLPENIRYRMAAAKCFPADEQKRQRYTQKDIPDSVKQAVKEFESKSPEARLMAKQMTQKTFVKFQKLLEVDVEKDFLVTRITGKGEDRQEVTEMDWPGRKNYVDSATKIIEALPELIKKLEEGYGITEVKRNDQQRNEDKSINKYHQNKKEVS